MDAQSALPPLLSTAVMLRIEQLKALSDSAFDLTRKTWLEEAEGAGVFTEAALFSGAKEGDTAKAFNGLAKVIAALAFHPGGVTSFGQHWEGIREQQSS